MLENPEQLGSCQATHHATERRIQRPGRDVSAPAFPMEDPCSDHDSDAHEQTETRDVK
jgi:hypothetical protein